jgi:serpin B
MAQLLRGVSGQADEWNDGQLLGRFLTARDEAAFAALVKRHGAMVLGVCRRILGNAADAEDTFQATFLVLVRKAGSLTGQAVLGDFLHGVARRTALNARRLAARRREKEQAMARPDVQGEEPRNDWLALLDEELVRLPEKYRVPVVVCDLEGATRREAGERLGWPEGTVAGRLARGRALLAARLARRGVALPVVAVVAALSDGVASAGVPAPLATATLEVAAGRAVGMTAARVTELTEEVMRAMLVSKLKIVAGTAILVLLVTAALGYAALVAEKRLAGGGQAGPRGRAGDASREVAGAGRQPGVAPRADVAALVRGNTTFALNLYKQLCKEKEREKGNLFLSPYSISSALAMTSAGARGDTLTELETALHLPAQDRLHPAFATLNGQMNGGEKRGYQMSVANALWGQRNHGFLPAFLGLTRDHYGAGFQEVDFAGDTEGARRTINAWVAQQTRDKIKELLERGILTGNTRLVLTNAIYFQGNWDKAFSKKDTREEPFLRGDGTRVRVPMMTHDQGGLGFCWADDCVALEIPYAGKDLAMLVLLPTKTDGLPALEKALTADRLARIVGGLRPRAISAQLPRFKTTTALQLNGTLQALGVRKAFADADFSGMNGGRDLRVAAVVHQAFVEVNEKGTEAAAGTAVALEVSAGAGFRADHPFLFLIRDKRNGSVLFLGRINDPTR